MMNEIREEASRIKAELIAKREKEREDEELITGRKIAQPKGKAGRYSDVHMAEFKKMDSIENHASSFRATPGRFTPVSSSKPKNLKRTQSKANLDDETPQAKTPGKGKLTSSKPSNKMTTPGKQTSTSPKRAKQQVDDDVTTNRPVSHDSSNIPQPKTPGKDSRGIPRAKTIAHLVSPTQSSLARVASATKTPTAPRSILKSPSKVTLTGLKKSATAFNLNSINNEAETSPQKLQTPSRFDKVKSIFMKQKATPSPAKPSILKPVAGLSKTPAPPRAQNDLPTGCFTTPGKKTARRVDFTPAPKHAALAQNSPSPVKSGIPRSKATNTLVDHPSLSTVTEGFTSTAGDTVLYPDLSGAEPLPQADAQEDDAMVLEEDSSDKPDELPVAMPGTFTFRSDHTIRFGSSSPKGFGGHSGQASVRHVRPSIMPPMPGAFPKTNSPQTAAPGGKENVPPYLQQDQTFNGKAFSHGVGTKKRHRVEDDEEEAEREAAERAAKKQKNATVPEGEALMAPRLTGTQRGNGIRSPTKIFKKSPMKSRIPTAPTPTTSGVRKPTSISMSRLAYLAQPKQRK